MRRMPRRLSGPQSSLSSILERSLKRLDLSLPVVAVVIEDAWTAANSSSTELNTVLDLCHIVRMKRLFNPSVHLTTVQVRHDLAPPRLPHNGYSHNLRSPPPPVGREYRGRRQLRKAAHSALV